MIGVEIADGLSLKHVATVALLSLFVFAHLYCLVVVVWEFIIKNNDLDLERPEPEGSDHSEYIYVPMFY